MSRAIASSILRKFSAWRSSRVVQGIWPSLVTPSTRNWISVPNSRPMSSAVALVSSTQSCSSPAQTDGTSRRSSEMIRATPDRMHDVGIAGAPLLAGVALGGEGEAALDEGEVGGRVVAANLGADLAGLRSLQDVRAPALARLRAAGRARSDPGGARASEPRHIWMTAP